MSENETRTATPTDPSPPWKSIEIHVDTVLTLYAPPYAKLTAGMVADAVRNLNLKNKDGEYDILEAQVHNAVQLLVEDAIGAAMSQTIMGDVLGPSEDAEVSMETVEWSESQVQGEMDLIQVELDESPIRVTVQDNKTYHA